MRHGLLLIAAMLGASIAGPADAQPSAKTAAGGAPVSFRRDVAPVFATNCAMCHQDAGPMGALSLTPGTALAMLKGVSSSQAQMNRVEPGSPEQSYLIRKLQGTHVAAGGKGLAMPIGQAPLTKQEMDQVRLWISQGAPDN
jgi:mono/diheme cytochrome c family protein